MWEPLAAAILGHLIDCRREGRVHPFPESRLHICSIGLLTRFGVIEHVALASLINGQASDALAIIRTSDVHRLPGDRPDPVIYSLLHELEIPGAKALLEAREAVGPRA